MFNNRSQVEEDLAQKNQEYLEQKRQQLDEMKGQGKEKKPKSLAYKFCCWGMVLLLAVSGTVIYYFVVNIKEEVISEYRQRKDDFQKVMPTAKDELKNSLQNAEALYNDTAEKITETQEKIDTAKETVEKAENLYDQANEVISQVK
ncbi:MAG: hypothetical protein WCT18_01795 [Patescibacteria group bacterium]